MGGHSAARVSRQTAGPGWTASLAAGAAAGLAAAAAGVAIELVAGTRLPPLDATAWSAGIAGVLGGILYGALSRLVRRPHLALWVASLAVATVDSILIITLPFPSGPGPDTGVPVYGLAVPLQQLAALAGIGAFGPHGYPRDQLLPVTALHYVTAVAVSMVVPRLADRRRRGR